MSVGETQKNKGGRPKKYETSQLKELLYDFVRNENPIKVKNADLVKYTGIPLHAWRFNNEIKKEIEQINKKLDNLTSITSIKDVTELMHIPSAEEIVDSNYKDRKKLIQVVNTLLEAYQFSLEKALYSDELEKENSALKKKISALNEDVEFYKDEMKKMAVDSKSLIERKEKNLKGDIIDIKKYSETKTTFKDLFDD